MLKISQITLASVVATRYKWKLNILNNWEKIIGGFKGKVIVYQIMDDLLILGVNNPALSQELFCVSNALKERVNSFLDKDRIKKIRFRYIDFNFKNINNLPKKDKNTTGKKITQLQKTISVLIDERVVKYFDNIQDNELKKEIKRFFVRCKNVQKKGALK